ncbi:hypothetical protein [Streptomyces sp. WAC07061]|uniref:hypothetical protein n=1 Tax=Streptomyces sp. WAC07061 TaxID=2487410 RepID=UPI00163B8A17|nr:hypothetical protein [Streptomyces sp. WAC07061]
MDPNSRTGRAPRGPLIGAVFGAVWFLIGLGALHGTARAAAAAAGALLVVAVTFAVLRSRRAPAPTPAGPVAPRGRAFVRLLVVQAVLLGVGAGLINSRLHTPQLAFAWAALVVGGHFFPLARVLGAPLLRVLGAVMVAVVAATAATALAAPGTTPWIWQALPGLGCAGALWAAVLATGARTRARRG